MPDLSKNQRGQLCLSLRGAADDPILTSLRHWSHWRDVVIERDPKTQQCVAVTLMTEMNYEPILRAILKRSFGLTFPEFLRTNEPAPAPPIRAQRRR